jgi:hypothetical protein
MGEWRGDGMTIIKTAMNNYQSFLQTNTKTGKGFNFLKCHNCTGQRVVLTIFYPIFLRSRRETFFSPHNYFA